MNALPGHVLTALSDNLDSLACSCGVTLKPPHSEGWWWGERWNVAEMHVTTGKVLA